MFTEERQSAIEKCLRENGKVKVKELSEMFQVTEDCIRKDLKTLENAGKLKRTYGGAILSQDYPLKRDVVDRRQFNLDKKRTIAAKAFKLIKNNETIFLDISTTNIELAKLLAASNMRVERTGVQTQSSRWWERSLCHPPAAQREFWRWGQHPRSWRASDRILRTHIPGRPRQSERLQAYSFE